MPESTLNQIQKSEQRPTSDIIMEAGRRLLTEVKKSTDSESSQSSKSKHNSLKLARSRSLDALSSPPLLEPEKVYDHDNDDASSVSISDDSSNGNNSAVLLKDEGPSSVLSDASPAASQKHQHVVESTLLKEKSELNYGNNNNNESYRNSSRRSSSISTSSSGSSNYSGTNHNKLGRRSSSTTTTTEGGSTAATFQDVVLNEPIRITGYLEKRSKVLGWKKFWFVLDGRLLTYYKSKTDYESLSACCGCVNLGIASTVRPIQLRGCKGYPLQIVTRSQVYYLRSPEKPVLEQWLLAIQEASSSPPSSSALTSWLGSSGSQYFRYSFASQSQWSLNNSSEDITETDISGRLGNLPDTFYQKRDRGSLIYPSPPTASQPSPIIHKCHSFASLQTSVVPFGGREGLYGRRVLLSSTENLRDLEEVDRGSRIKSATMQHSTSLLVLDSSPQAAELRKELTRKLSGGSSANSKPNEDGADKDQNGSNNVPTPKFLLLSGKKNQNVEHGGGGDEESHHYDEIGDFIVGKPHYENCDAEKVNGGGCQPSSKRNSLRGESAEKESNIYEHVETGDSMSMSLESGIPAPVTWEPINDPSCANINKRFPPHRLSAGSNRNSLVSISEVPEDISSASPSPIKTPVLSSIPESSWRSGVEPFKSYGKPYSEDEVSSGRSESFRSLPCAEKTPKKRKGKAAIGGFFAKVFGKGKAKGVKADSQENLHKPMIITGPVDLRKQVQMKELPVRKPPSGYPYKKSASTTSTSSSKSNKETSSNSKDNPPEKVEKQAEAPRTSPTFPGSRMTINNTNVMDELKQKVGHITLKRTSSRSSSGSDSELSPPKEPTKSKNANPPPTVEARVPYVPRTSTTSTKEIAKPAPVLILQMDDNCESNTDDDIPIPAHEKEVQSASMSIYQDSETSCSEAGTLPRTETKLQMVGMTVPPAPPLPKKSPVNEDVMDGGKVIIKSDNAPNHRTPPVVQRNPQRGDPETDFQTKLAKFNRLSQRLSANFIASLHPTHANHTFGAMTRSNSYKGRGKGNANGDESLPPLPPKKKNAAGLISASTGMITLYDVPLNNKPVMFKGPQNSTDSLDDDDQSQNRSEEKTIAAYIRDLTKKNSNPDIVLSGNGSKSIRLRDVMTDAKELRRTLDGSSDENLDVHKSSPSIPPGRPPKPKPPVKPKSLELGINRIKLTSESSTSSEGSSEQSQVTPTLKVPAQGFSVKSLGNDYSPATSNRPLNIDSIDVLSDAGLSDTKASDSSPDSDSPSSSCLIHPTDFAYSTHAKSPESMISFSDKIVLDSLATTPDTDITLGTPDSHLPDFGVDSDMEPMSINKLEIVIRDNDASPGLITQSPDNESGMDSLERRPGKLVSVIPSNSDSFPPNIYQNLKFATVHTLIQEFETVEENEDEVSELYDDFPSEFYTPTPSSLSGYSPSDISTTSSSDSSTLSMPSSSALKKHARIDAIRNSGMEQLEAFLNFGGTSSLDEYSFESCIDSSSEESSGTTPIPFHHHNVSNNVSKNKNPSPFMGEPQQIHSSGSQASNAWPGVNRTGAISRLGHSSAVGHLEKILTNDVKQNI